MYIGGSGWRENLCSDTMLQTGRNIFIIALSLLIKYNKTKLNSLVREVLNKCHEPAFDHTFSPITMTTFVCPCLQLTGNQTHFKTLIIAKLAELCHSEMCELQVNYGQWHWHFGDVHMGGKKFAVQVSFKTPCILYFWAL